MTVKLNEENRFKYGHAHCYVVDAEKEGYDVSELKRYLEVEDIRYIYPKQEEGECTAKLNIDEPRPEELTQEYKNGKAIGREIKYNKRGIALK